MARRIFAFLLFCFCLAAKPSGGIPLNYLCTQVEQDTKTEQEFCSNLPINEIHAILVTNPKLAEYKKPVYRYFKNYRKFSTYSLFPRARVGTLTRKDQPKAVTEENCLPGQTEILILHRNLRL